MSVLRLWPQPAVTAELRGLYLQEDVRALAQPGAPFVYSNFVTSLDGRIAVARNGRMGVPPATGNARDWRLFQELAAQADVLLVSGPFMHKLASGAAEPIAQFDRPQYADLADWRAARGLPPLPDLAVVSRSLDFTLGAKALAHGRRVRVVTSESAAAPRRQQLAAEGAEIVIAGDEGVTGDGLIAALAARGYLTIYSPAGPNILHLLAAADRLDRLYLTYAPALLGGDAYLTLAEGAVFEPARRFDLLSLYYDAAAGAPQGQLFAAYGRRAGHGCG